MVFEVVRRSSSCYEHITYQTNSVKVNTFERIFFTLIRCWDNETGQ